MRGCGYDRGMWIQFVQVALQTVSSLAIAGGLVYAAVQFRESRKAAHVANFAKLVEMQMRQRELRVQRPELARVYQHDVAHAKNDEEIREYFMNLIQLSIFEIVWFSYRQGQLPRDYFESWERRMTQIAREASFQRMIRTPSMKIMHDEFQEYVMELIERVGGQETVAKARARWGRGARVRPGTGNGGASGGGGGTEKGPA